MITHDTFVLERSFPKASAARLFAALSDPAIKRQWFAEGDHHEVVAYAASFEVNGVERVVYRMGPQTPFPGVTYGSTGVYLDIVAGERIVQASTMSFAGAIMSAALITFEILADPDSSGGSRLKMTHQAAFYPNADGPALRLQGWNVLLDRLVAHAGEN